MKSSIAALTLCATLAAISARAQTPDPCRTPNAPTPSATTGSASVAPGEKTARAAPPIKPPDRPVEAYLLKEENGPYMVIAKVFRGPDAEALALGLCKELRQDFGMPAYILRTKDWFPMPKNAGANRPGEVRIHEEVAVLVGDEKNVAAREILLNKVKKLDPKCLRQPKNVFPWRSGLSRAFGITNPYVTAELPRP